MAGYKFPSSSFDSAEKSNAIFFLSPGVNLRTPWQQSFETCFDEPEKEGSRSQFNKLPKFRCVKALLRWMTTLSLQVSLKQCFE